MPYFVDTDFFIAMVNKNDDNHDKAEEIYVDIDNGVYGKVVTSDYILDEAITCTRARTKSYNLAVRIVEMISNSVMVEMRFVTKNDVLEAIKRYKLYKDKDLSFTDWVSVILIESRGMHGIISFDKHFDQVKIKRICEAKL